MKFILTKRAKRLIGLFICIFLLAVTFFNIAGYFLDLKYVNVFAAMAEANKYEVKSSLLMEAMNQVGVCSAKDAAEVWANGLMVRSAALQYSVMSENLKNEYAKQLEQSFPNWVTGMSSPWVEMYEILTTNKPDENTYIFKLKISTKTSTGPAGDYYAVLTVAREGDFWRISKINMDKELYAYTGFIPKS